MSGTPRSGRVKKKSALSRLAEKSNNTPRGSLSSDQEMSVPSQQSNRPDDIADTLHRQRLGAETHRRTSDDYARNNHHGRSDSDEGIEMGAATSCTAANERHKGSTAKHDLLDGYKKNTVYSDDDDEEDDDDDDLQTSYGKGEKRYRDQNSDSDDLKCRSHKEPLRSSPLCAESASNERPSSRLGYEENMNMSGRLQRCQDLSDDDSDEYKSDSKHKQSPDLRKRLSLKHTREDITTLYQDAIQRHERESEMNDLDYGSEGIDGLADLKHQSASPPKHSDKSPEHHSYNHKISSASLMSTISSRTFMFDRDKSDPFAGTSQDSLQSTSVLPVISTKEARNRSFLVGSVTSNGSILGPDELERFFPDRKMRIFIGTWNMCEMKLVPSCIDDFILPDTSEYVHDMYVIGTQESCPNRREWAIKLQETLGPHHVLLHAASCGVLYLCIFIRKDLIWYTSVCEEASVTTRSGPSGVKTKGACAVSFHVFGTSFLFVNAHFAPHDGHAKQRIADYHKICSSLQLPKVRNQNRKQEGDVTTRFDCVFWLGDLNFRIQKERQQISHKLKAIESQEIPYFDELMSYDELFIARNEGLAFVDFQEGRIKFKPTYKYDIGTDEFDTSKKLRIPSYTDRILFRCHKKNGITCLHYNSAQEVRVSDHRPVYGMYEVNLRPGRDNIQLSAAQFDKEVWLEGMRRRALSRDVSIRMQKNSSVCSIQ